MGSSLSKVKVSNGFGKRLMRGVIIFFTKLCDLLMHMFVSFSSYAHRYRIHSPTNDLSIFMEGNVARDGHRFANAQWGYIVRKQR